MREIKICIKSYKTLYSYYIVLIELTKQLYNENHRDLAKIVNII
jgi:hypothetical protein